MAEDAQIQELERLQGLLASRDSVLHFANAGLAMVVAVIMGGASGKLFWDSFRTPWLGFIAAAISLSAAAYSVTRYGRGRRALAWELESFESLKALRRTLRLDDPSALLPQ